MNQRWMVFLPLATSLALLAPVRVLAQSDEGVVQAMIPEKRDVTRAARMRTFQDGAPGNDPDTVWIGHIYDQTYTAGGKMVAGGYGPYRVGRGPNRPTRAGAPVTIGDNGTWDFDRFQGPFAPNGAETDSLQGWWPLARAYQSGATTFGDFRRAFFGLDYGNQVNYVINQGSPKRTFGVVGLWHRDRGNITYVASDTVEDKDPIAPGTQDNITNVQPVLWSPTEVGGPGSTASAWMGLRSHGDLSHRDELANGGTGNYFNAAAMDYHGNNGFNQIGSVHVNGTNRNFPGYGSQMDQMLYRDVQLTEGQGLTVSFNYSTNMSLGKNTVGGTQVGWFDKDPLSNAQSGVGAGATPTSDGNFICASVAGANAPCDSFMVYVGAPVNDSDVRFSAPLFVGGNEITTVYDPQRRWFSEVLQLASECVSGAPCSIIGKEIATYAGIHAPTAVSLNFGALYPAALQAIKDADGVTGNGGTARIVFRVKTNRGFDDQNFGNPASTFDSGTRGATIVDNVVVNAWPAADGNFEAADAINNDVGVSALDAWKSTGKPPGVYYHAHSVAPGQGLAFNDPCGGLDNPNRQCNLYGKIVTAGDHDAGEKDGGVFGSNTQDRLRWLVSPTINLSSTGNGPGFYNAMGIDDEVARTTFDYALFASLYNAGLVNATTATGNFISMAVQSYPARASNGNIKWGEVRNTSGIFFYGTRGCFETFFPQAPGSIGFKANGLIRTTNPHNRPDSMRVYLHRFSRCYTFALVEATCSPTVGDNVGVYLDNVSLALIDGVTAPAISIPIWMLINDAFPANGNDALIPTGFDTTAAQVRTNFNIAAQIGSLARPAIGGDSVVVTAPGNDTRLDMVFRIDPGPGNYMTIGNRGSGVTRRPDGKPAGYVAATAGDGSFFGQYMSSPGPFGKGNHTGGWNKNTWNSARMDTVERNLFRTANNASVVGLVPGDWAGMLHEDDPNFATLGIAKNICVMPAPAGPATSTNIICDGTGWGAYGAGSGWNSATTTQEYTKIIPDGLLTPGSHVQYFFRNSQASDNGATVRGNGPDSNFVLQDAEGSNDGHRWQQFSVLPDRWKSNQWAVGDQHASQPACMLYIDWCDRRGDELVWVGIADTIGATAQARWGAHNGWHGDNNQDITVDLRTVIGTADDYGAYLHGGQPGTIWDMYGVKASEASTTSSSLGSRTASLPTGYQAGKQNLNGPSGLMLRHYYSVILALTGDLNAGNIGPYVDKGDNDVGLLQDFAYNVAGMPQPRQIWFQGRGFVEGQCTGGMGCSGFIQTYFGVSLVSGDYRSYAGNTTDVVDLQVFPPIHDPTTRYGVLSSCAIQNDVLTVVGGFGASMAAKYPDSGANPNPKIASVYAPSSLPGTAHPMVTLVDGFRILSLGTVQTLTSYGRLHYYYTVLSKLASGLSCASNLAAPVSVGEDRNPVLVNFLAMGSENPLREGSAKITFGITRRERVELKVYDVTGRLVRTLASREFAPGEHSLYWDGAGDDGRAVARGVYFYQLRTPTFVSQRKLAMLKR